MNVLHINQSDVIGGAGIAAYRLHQGLLAHNIHSKLLVKVVGTQDPLVAPIPLKPWIEKQLARMTWRLGLNHLNYISTFSLGNHPFYQEADLLNFHNLHTEFFNYLALPSLTKHKPAVFRLPDMWSFTGHCAYSYDCERWKIGCGKCPYPNNYLPVRRDNTHLEWKLKQWAYAHSNLTIVTPSRWLAEQAKQSMLKQFPIYHIPNGIDLNIYHPLDMEPCRYVFGIPMEKKVLLFGAEDVMNPRKGGDLLLKAIQLLPESLKSELFFIVFGVGGKTIAAMTGIPTLDLGYINMERLKVVTFAMADLFVFPTRADNLPVVLEESLACGIPMVSCDVGGVSDLVRPGITGYLARPEDPQDFCHGIVQLLEDIELRKCMRQNCRSIAVEEFSLSLQVKRYIEVYHQILVGKNYGDTKSINPAA